jgi:hypothetical protein
MPNDLSPVVRQAVHVLVLAAMLVPAIRANAGEIDTGVQPSTPLHLVAPHPTAPGGPDGDIRPGESPGFDFPGDPVIRVRPVIVQHDALATIDPAAKESHVLSLFADVQLRLVFEQFEPKPNGFVWTGGIEDDPVGWFAVAVRDGTVVWYIWTGDGPTYNIRPVPEDSPHWPMAVVRELEPAHFAPCVLGQGQIVRLNRDEARGQAGGATASSSPADTQSDSEHLALAGEVACGADDGSVFDVMIVYTPAARVAAGGYNAIHALAELCITSTNNAYHNSQINPRARLVYVGEVQYTESGSFSTDLARLRGTADGYMDEVHPIRDDVGADLVALLNNTGGSCGIAYLMTTLSPSFASWAFSVTRYSCAVGNLTFAHELGHNMGCAHDHDSAGPALFSYSYGHRWQGAGGLRRSVMAYPPGTRVAHFSNPDVHHDGAPTGVPPGMPGQAHNALSINNAAWTVSQFRTSVCAPPDNNECQSPLVVGAGVYEFDTTHATTTGPAEPGMCTFGGDDNIHNDVWFGYVAQCDGEVTVALCGSDYPAKLGVYPFQCPSQPGTVIACAISGCDGGGPQVTLQVSQNEAFRIRVGGQNGAGGEGTLTITCTPDAPACVGNLNGDDTVDVLDLLILLDAWGPAPGSDADLNGDGTVDVLDLLILLDAWGPC